VRVTLIAVGHKMPAWVEAGFDDYARRMTADLPLTLVEIKPAHRVAGGDGGRARRIEAERILAALPAASSAIVLDEKGVAPTTRELADWLARWMQEGVEPAFVIGGADGLDASVKARAAKLVSLSRLTLPHALVRVLLAEQLYRAASILKGHPYHRQ
jgi:23S rRNA (pseudouridine1915-N3)-methyltransferase